MAYINVVSVYKPKPTGKAINKKKNIDIIHAIMLVILSPKHSFFYNF